MMTNVNKTDKNAQHIYIYIFFEIVKGYDRSFDNDKQTQVESYLQKKSMKGQLHQVMKMCEGL